MIEKIIVVAPDHGRTDEHRLGGRLEGIARGVVRFEVMLASLEVGREAEIAFDFLLDARDVLGLSQFKHDWALSVTGP